MRASPVTVGAGEALRTIVNSTVLANFVDSVTVASAAAVPFGIVTSALVVSPLTAYTVTFSAFA